MWTVFAVSFALYEYAAASKPADLAFYVSVAVATPVAGYIALRISQRFALRSAHVLWFATITFLIVTISTTPLHRSPIFLFSLAVIYLVIASVIVFLPRKAGVVMERALAQRSWIPNLAAIAAAASFLWLALWNSRPYFYWPTEDPSLAGFGYDLTKYGPSFNRVLLG